MTNRYALPPLPEPLCNLPTYCQDAIRQYTRTVLDDHLSDQEAAIEADRKRQYCTVYEEGWKDALEWADRKRRGEPWMPVESCPGGNGVRYLFVRDCGQGTLPAVEMGYMLDADTEVYMDSTHEPFTKYGYRVTHWTHLPGLPNTPQPAEPVDVDHGETPVNIGLEAETGSDLGGVVDHGEAEPGSYVHTAPDNCETLHWRGQILSLNELAAISAGPVKAWHDCVPRQHQNPDKFVMPAEPVTPRTQFEDARVQKVYEIICGDNHPPYGEHWDGYVSRLIVDALFPAEPVKVPSDADILDLWTGDPTHSRPVMGKNKVIAFARALLARYGKGTP